MLGEVFPSKFLVFVFFGLGRDELSWAFCLVLTVLFTTRKNSVVRLYCIIKNGSYCIDCCIAKLYGNARYTSIEGVRE